MDDQMLTYPTDKVVGVAPDRATLHAARRALDVAGVDDERIEVLGGADAAADEPGESVEEDGFIASVIRTVKTGFGEEATRLRALNEAIDRGQFVIQVALPRESGDIRDEDKRTVGDALREAGVGNVAFYGRLTVEELQIGA